MSQLYDTPWSPTTEQAPFSPASAFSVLSPITPRPDGAMRLDSINPVSEHDDAGYIATHAYGGPYQPVLPEDEYDPSPKDDGYNLKPLGYHLPPDEEADIANVYRAERHRVMGPSPRMSINLVGGFDADEFRPSSTATLISRPASIHFPPPPENSFLVTIGPDDSRHPYNWSMAKKWTVLIVVCSAAVCVTVASSIQASTYENLEDEFDMPRIQAVAGVSLYVLGFGIGALFLGPLSEFYGRSIIYLVSFALFTVFNIPIATAQNMGIFLLFRLVTGLCGAGFLSVAGGTVSDMFRPGTTDLPTAIYTLAPLSGPCLGPILGGYMNQNMNWRPIFYLIIGWGAVEFALLFFLVPETFLPIVQKREARRMRADTGEGMWTSPAENSGRTVSDVFPGALWVPIKLMAVEKMALAMDTWTSLILGIIYLFFNAIPYTFRTLYGFNLGETGLAFFALLLGMVLGTATQPFFISRIKDKGLKSGSKPAPETRLTVGMAGAILSPVGLLWFALSSFSKMPWIMPMIGTLIFGVGSVYIFTCVFGFLVATYPKYAASAMAGNTLLRCVWAAGFPLFALPMYEALGPEGATGLLAALCAMLAPIPFVLARIGPRLRAKSEYAS
ncbi:hypothetical protein CspeluHIS016_0902710 [Cutaneotrichosporon spelunceum]|uniref:Major facilitator superfamily (MFS) profile domain-containing protein n=1 Tax=Cutaneotrichosporon spelunceum TaxID=1672016 RepID=A0AAD3YFF9_9TREE|nr:hypothetical protein CspeluHIS016_0902710 [Cutaneotrichosporon spelunceum]